MRTSCTKRFSIVKIEEDTNFVLVCRPCHTQKMTRQKCFEISVPCQVAQGQHAVPFHLHLLRKEHKSARSDSFFMPANTIFVPGMYFFGLIRYSNMCLSDQRMPEFLFASE
mmetsp:Transcript_135544/g.270433  ORF Transcript_135544/g.270433 Transcript_135544/m.270433 type:complete len:111 (-) Transcript_135544:220-552(-)